MEFKLSNKKNYSNLVTGIFFLLFGVGITFSEKKGPLDDIYVIIVTIIISSFFYYLHIKEKNNFMELFRKTKLVINKHGLLFISGSLETQLSWEKIKKIDIKENSKSVKEIIIISSGNDEIDLHLYDNLSSIKHEISKYRII